MHCQVSISALLLASLDISYNTVVGSATPCRADLLFVVASFVAVVFRCLLFVACYRVLSGKFVQRYDVMVPDDSAKRLRFWCVGCVCTPETILMTTPDERRVGDEGCVLVIGDITVVAVADVSI